MGVENKRFAVAGLFPPPAVRRCRAVIVSASRRTDIPCYYSRWFINRIKAGSVWVRNPFHPRQISEISLSPQVVDGVVFWSKNPAPLLPLLGQVPYPFYFQFTLTPYGRDLEPGLPEKRQLIDLFWQLSRATSPKQVVWRYDPILISPTYTVAYHLRSFDAMARRLAGAADSCVISFLDSYQKTGRAGRDLGLRAPNRAEIEQLAPAFSETAAACGFALSTCCESVGLSQWGISHGRCVDAGRLAAISGIPLRHLPDRGQRPGCGCCESVDVGVYDSCLNGCRYCYAGGGGQSALRRYERYDEYSPLLCSALAPGDQVAKREAVSLVDDQLRFF